MFRAIKQRVVVFAFGVGALFFSVIFLFPTPIHAAVKDAPADDSTFYVNLMSDGTGVPMMLLPTELGLSYARQYYAGAMGVLVSNGVVIEETNPANMENTHNKKCGTVPGWACSGNFKVSGVYKSGHLTVVSMGDETYAYDGTPIQQGGIYNSDGSVKKMFAPVSIIPGNVSFKSETRYECDVENATTFTCAMTRIFVKEPIAECAEKRAFSAYPYAGAYGWDICAKGRYVTKPQQTKTGTIKAFVAPLDGMAIVSALSGDVEVVRADKTVTPARLGAVLKKGDAIMTLPDTSAHLDFGYGTLEVWSLTSLRVDKFTSKDNIAKTQLYLNVGAIRVKTKHTAAIRSDFSVATPGANASIRGSEMFVAYDEKTKITTVATLEDKAYVKGKADTNEIELPENKQVVVGEDGRAGQIEPLTVVSPLAKDSVSGRFKFWAYGAAIVAVVILIGLVFRRVRR